MVDGGRKEGRSQKTFRNGSGSDVEVYLRAENKAFLFRQSFTPSDDGHQADGFFGWRLLGDPILNEYTIVMRYQYFMRADDELRYVSYLAELEIDATVDGSESLRSIVTRCVDPFACDYHDPVRQRLSVFVSVPCRDYHDPSSSAVGPQAEPQVDRQIFLSV